MTGWEHLVVLLAGVGAGTINTIVGSGTLITFPTLVLLGVPPITANVSNTIGLVPGTVSGAVGYRRELAGQRHAATVLGLAAGIGGLVGGIALLTAPSEAFDAIVPVLIVGAVLAMVAQPRIAAAVERRRAAKVREHEAAVSAEAAEAVASARARGDVAPDGGHRVIPGAVTLGVGATGVYGGYFGAAQGILLMAVLGTGLPDHLQRTNALKNVIAVFPNLVAAGLFIAVADVDWGIAGLVAIGSVLGGQLGARIGRRMSPTVLRTVVVVIGLVAVVQLLRT